MKTIDQVYCAATTPFSRDQSIDYSGFQQNLQWYASRGLYGVLVCGGTGEFVSLSTQERMRLVDCAAKVIAGKQGFMVGCAAETTAEAIAHARYARQAGADGVLMIASYYFKPSPDELFGHFRAVAESIDIPLVLYNNPGSCGSDLTPELVSRLLAVDNIRHMKEATGDLLRFRALRAMCGERLHALCGCDALAYELFENGATGWISITANALPAQSQFIFDAMARGERAEAWALFQRMLPLYTACEQPYKAVQTVKYMMERMGLCGGASRLPRLPLTDDEKAGVDALMRDAGIAAPGTAAPTVAAPGGEAV